MKRLIIDEHGRRLVTPGRGAAGAMNIQPGGRETRNTHHENLRASVPWCSANIMTHGKNAESPLDSVDMRHG